MNEPAYTLKQAVEGSPHRVRDGMAILSFVLGLATLIFPTISVLYLIVANGGPGYLQSLFCGVPVAAISILAGLVAVVERRRNNQPGSWMAMSGVVLGFLFFVIATGLVLVLLFPYLSGIAD
jgi:hypothetical protein